MTDLTPETTVSRRAPRRRLSAPPAWLVALLAAVLVGLSALVVWETSRPEPAAANPLTSVRNLGSLTGAPPYVTVVRDNGSHVLLSYAGQTVWGVKAVRVERGQCIRLNGAPARCATATTGAFNIALGISSYTVERTK